MSWMLILSWVLAYLAGALPFGWAIVWLVKHKDIRYQNSGRMGMSNVLRTAGTFWGILTALLDIAKGYLAVQLVRWLVADWQSWMLPIAGILAVVGHIYSIFMIEKRRDGKYYFRGGAGGLTSTGAGFALWWPYIIFVPLPCLLIYLFIGYASVATVALNIVAAIAFAIAAALGETSWWYVGYASVAGALVALSLRPNFKRLARGDERKTSLRIRWRKSDRDEDKK